MIEIILPDGTKQNYNEPITGFQIAKDIGPKLFKDAVALEVNNHLNDLTHVITENSNVRIITKKDPDALHILRHSSAHLLAQAVMNLYPRTQYGTGPSTEDGFYYDFLFADPLSDTELKNIENEMRRIINLSQPFIKTSCKRKMAKEYFLNQKYKLELIDTADSTEGVQKSDVTIYSNDGFKDLCLGPHVPDTSYLKSFKLLRIAGAYWRGNESNDQLQRIYGTSWFNNQDLEQFLIQREEAVKRDHRKLGNTLDLFISPAEIGPGQYIWKPRGSVLRDCIETFSKDTHKENGYEMVYTPHIGMASLWERSGHLGFYKDAMYPSIKSQDGSEYYLKPMNCPFHILAYKSNTRSYRELPVRLFELGSVYRYEKTGVLHGLMRARGFTQDDAHIFCTIDQIDAELASLLNFSIAVLNAFGFYKIEADLSTKPIEAIGLDKIWETATESLKNSLNVKSIPYKIAVGEGAFYGPKIDLHVKDAIGRRWQLSTIQLDFVQPDNFKLGYVSKENKQETPVMIHRALLGSIERFIGILLENYNGNLPGWLSPDQIVLISLNENVINYSKGVLKILKKYRVKHDYLNIRLSEKIKKYKLLKIPIIIIVGDEDKKSNTIAINFSDGRNIQNIDIKLAIKLIKEYLKIPKVKI